jgi:hypothetical protein
VVAVAGIAAYISYLHAYAVVREYGESGVTALLEPATIDGLVYASSMVMLDCARQGALARWLLGLGIAASLAANVAHGLGHGPVGAAVGAWPAVALVGRYELLMMVIRGAQQPSGDVSSVAEEVPAGVPDLLQAKPAEEFAADLAGRARPFDSDYTRTTARWAVTRPTRAGLSRHASGWIDSLSGWARTAHFRTLTGHVSKGSLPDG